MEGLRQNGQIDSRVIDGNTFDVPVTVFQIFQAVFFGKLLTKLRPADISVGDQFGGTVGMSKRLIVVGASWGDSERAKDTGAAYAFDPATGKELVILRSTRKSGASVESRRVSRYQVFHWQRRHAPFPISQFSRRPRRVAALACKSAGSNRSGFDTDVDQGRCAVAVGQAVWT